MAIASLFRSEAKTLLEKARTRVFSDPEEKTEVLDAISASRDIKVADAVELLLSPDSDVRRSAARLLAARRDPETVRHFLVAATGRPEGARRAGLAVLVESVPNVAALLGQAFQDGEGDTRTLAADALLELKLDASSLPLIVRVIERGGARHRLKGVTRLAAVADERYLGFFEGLIADADERIREAAYQVFLRYAGADKLPFLLERVPLEPYATQQLLIPGIQRLVPEAGPDALGLVLGLLSSGNNALRSAALRILLSLPDRVDTIRRFIAYSRGLAGWVRERALGSMREFGAEVVGPALELVADPDAEVRSMALGIVSNFDDPRVGEAAIRLLDDPDWWLAITAAELLGRRRDARGIPKLIEILNRPDVRWAAVEALGRIGGRDASDALQALVNDGRPEIRIEALSALALSGDPGVVPVLKHVAETDSLKPVRARALDLLRQVATRHSGEGAPPLQVREKRVDLANNALDAHRLLAETRRRCGSDLHISVDAPPIIRLHGELVRLPGEPLTASAADALLKPLLTVDQLDRLERDKQLDAGFYVENDGRYRGNLFIDRKGLNAVFRVIPELPPSIPDLGLPSDVAEIATFHQGMVIITGPSGSGKSTSLAALVNLVNEMRRSHIITLEDPVELVHPFRNSLVNQRDVGKHTQSYARALRAALREDPDVIVIGELRDQETVSLALTAAETGHLVLTTLNASTAAKAVDRVISSFPADEQPQIRETLAGCLKLVIAQALMPGVGERGRVGCFEVLKNTFAVASMIRDNKCFQLTSLMQIGQHVGMRTFDDALLALVSEGKIAPETAYMRATNKEAFASLVPPKFLEELLA